MTTLLQKLAARARATSPRRPSVRLGVERLEDRWAPALTTTFLGGANPDTALVAGMTNAFVAEGRIGSSAYPGQNFTFEVDVNKSTAGPFGLGQTGDILWSTTAGTPFTLN